MPELVRDYLKAGLPKSIATGSAIYLSHPADYSGDAWHVAAAMVLSSDVETILTAQSTDEKSKDMKESKKFVTFYKAIGVWGQVADKRGNVFKVGEGGNNAAESHRWPVLAHCAQAEKLTGKKVGTVYSSTSVLMHALAANGATAVTAMLRARFCVDDLPKAMLEVTGKILSGAAPTSS